LPIPSLRPTRCLPLISKLALPQHAARTGLSGKDLTPYLLARINELTGGRSR
jgi:pseudouridine-5'-phosphate glycosidase